MRTHACKEDKRVRIVELTDKSRKLKNEIENSRDSFHKRMYKNINKAEREELVNLLNKVYRNLQEVEENV